MTKVQAEKKRILKLRGAELNQFSELIKTLFTIKNTKFAKTIIKFYNDFNLKVQKQQEVAQLEQQEFNSKHSDKLQSFEKKRIELLEANALKNEAGEFLFKEGTDGQKYYDFDEKGIKAYTEAYTKLTEEHKEIIETLGEITTKNANLLFEIEISICDLDYFLDEIKDLSVNDIDNLNHFYNYLNK